MISMMETKPIDCCILEVPLAMEVEFRISEV